MRTEVEWTENEFQRDVKDIISKASVDLRLLRRFSQFGFPINLRGTCWKLLLGYLSPQQSEWQQQHNHHKDLYKTFLDEHLSVYYSDKDLQQSLNLNKLQDSPDVCSLRQYLTMKVGGDKKDYNENLKLWEQIEKDTMRTRQELKFFQSPISTKEIKKIQFLTYTTTERLNTGDILMNHGDILSRILYIYGKLNTQIRYVQGMNELLSNLYYVFMSGRDYLTAESDAYFVFQILMQQTNDNFIRTFDNSTGIKVKITKMSDLLKEIDQDLWNHLNQINLDPIYYGYRWILLYLSHEFPVQDILKIWDSVFSKSHHSWSIICLCVTILQMLREQILSCDFNKALVLLQNIKITNITELIQTANSYETLYQR